MSPNFNPPQGIQIPDGLAFTYELGPVAVGANAVVTQQVQIQDSAFAWIFAVAVSTGIFSVLISDLSTKRPFSNQAVHRDNLFGTAQNPMPLLQPFIFSQKGGILVQITDLSGALNSVRLGFIGVELAGR